MSFSPMSQIPVQSPMQGGANYPPFIPGWGRAPTSNDLSYLPGTRVQYVTGGVATIYEFNGFGWNIGGIVNATTSTPGIVQLSTLAQLEAGSAPSGAIVPLANDVNTFVNAV